MGKMADITLTADKLKVSGPRIDGSYALTFEVGEYEQKEIAKCVMLPKDELIRLEITSGP